MPDAGELSSSVNVRRVAGLNRLVGDASTGYYNLTNCPNTTCDTQNLPATALDTPNLKPETSEQFSITVNTAITIDYWHIEIKNQVSRIEPQDVIDLSHANALDSYNPKQIYINRDTNGQIIFVGFGYINMVGVETSGLDLTFNASADFDDMGAQIYLRW
nr:TonB-dependent receptor [Pseudoalteromonas luteoviolacea]